MRMNALLLRLRRRAADESGFTMIIAMMVLMIVTLLIGAAFVAANGDVENSRHDVDAKRAYYSARAGLSRFLFLLNKNNELWQTCPTQTSTTRARRNRSDLRLPAAPRERPVRLHDGEPGRDLHRPRHRQLPHALHRHLERRLAHDRCPVQAAQPARLSLLLEVRDARPEHLRRPIELPGLRGLHPRQPAVQVRLHPVGYGRRHQRTALYAGSVRDLRLADVRAPRQVRHDAVSGARACDTDDPDLRRDSHLQHPDRGAPWRCRHDRPAGRQHQPAAVRHRKRSCLHGQDPDHTQRDIRERDQRFGSPGARLRRAAQSASPRIRSST